MANSPIKYFKMEITDNNYNAEYVGMAEFELYDENGLKIPLTDSMIEVDSFYNNSYVKANLIDGNTSTRWNNNNTNPSWVKITFNTPTIVSKVRFFGYGTVVGQAPYTFNFQVSNNDVNWTIIKEEYQTTTNNIWYESTLEYNINDRLIIKNPTTSKIYSLDTNTLIHLPSSSDKNMILHGLEEGKEVQLEAPFNKMKFVQDTSEVLGSGKVFTHEIDTSKVKVNKIIL